MQHKKELVLTQEYLKECLDYDPDTGIFTWKSRPRHHFINNNAYGSFQRSVGKPAGYIQQEYVMIQIKIFNLFDPSPVLHRHFYLAHRLAWFYVHGKFPDPDLIIDHINHEKNDNRIDNLQVRTRSENNQNTRLTSRNTSGYKGVSLNKKTNKYEAKIGVSGKTIYCGLYDNIEDAIVARKNAELKYFTNSLHHNIKHNKTVVRKAKKKLIGLELFMEK